jgi:hypothetical protein
VYECGRVQRDEGRCGAVFFPFFCSFPFSAFARILSVLLLRLAFFHAKLTLLFPLQVYVNIGRGTTTDQEKLVEALQARPSEGEAEDATGTLRIGAASLECVILLIPAPSYSVHARS